ncbi:MAG: hypothetical protein MR765_01855 [Tenericutes bacterium]|nr:hypothetical protein [Mycoplasmatota bacterium]
MNKKGFIATSLLYSFFLLFCALILVFIGNMAQKSILLNKEIDQINEDLHSIKYLKDAKIGSYFRLNVCVSSSYFNKADTLDYIIFDNGTTNENNMASLISKNYSFKLNSLELINNILSYISVKQGENTIESRSMTTNDYEQKISKIEDEKVRKLLIYSDFNYDTMYLLTDKNNYTSSKVIEIKENIDKNTIPKMQDLNNDYINNEKVFVRLVFDIHNETMIIGGDGTSTNPFILKGGATPCQ